MTDFPKRKRMRLSGFDYNECYRVFLTICVKDRRCLLARIVGTGVPDGPHCVPQSEARVELKRAGKIADEVIRKMNSFYEYVSVDEYVIMPNHIHFLLSFYPEGDSCSEDGPSGTPVPTGNAKQNSRLSKFSSSFKRFCNKEYGENLWQYRSYDHVIRDRDDLVKHINYIWENPARWHLDQLYSESFLF